MLNAECETTKEDRRALADVGGIPPTCVGTRTHVCRKVHIEGGQDTIRNADAKPHRLQLYPVQYPKPDRRDSIRRQSEAAERYCKDHGLTLATDTVRDLGISAFHGKNAKQGALADFLSAVKTGTIAKGSTLLIENIDRLSRQEPLESIELIGDIVRAGITLVTLSDNQVFTRKTLNENPGQFFMLIGSIQRAHGESARKSELSRANWTRKRQQAKGGIAQASRYPGWIQLVDGKFLLVPERADVMNQISTMLLAGRGFQAVAGELNKKGIPSFNRKNATGKWMQTVIQYLAMSRTTIGEYQPNTVSGNRRIPAGEPIANYYPAVWTEEIFTKIQAVLATRRRCGIRGKIGDCVTNLFGGLLMNGIDGSKAKVKRGCVISDAMIQRTVPYTSFDYDAFEFHALKWISEIQLKNTSDTSRLEFMIAQHTETTAKIAAVSARLENAAAAEYPRMLDLLAKLETTEKQQAKAVEIEKATNAQPRSTQEVARLADEMSTMPKAERLAIRSRLRVAIAAVVKRIEIFPFTADRYVRLAIAHVVMVDGTHREFGIRAGRYSIPISHSFGARFEYAGTQTDFKAMGEMMIGNPQFADPSPLVFARISGEAMMESTRGKMVLHVGEARAVVVSPRLLLSTRVG